MTSNITVNINRARHALATAVSWGTDDPAPHAAVRTGPADLDLPLGMPMARPRPPRAAEVATPAPARRGPARRRPAVVRG
ncbi:hypothetical protein [Streptomyces sp. H39-S7]|uniref:hypothetical protein n=1 Tax=Streptomyces sp. H39-S7 TaxID=3004357 RepID=UPI0022B06A39|nr:hypothetical protein [Streptomyces sp. H39-S7]MCZ4120878.1 hypothetical protein [Streptomyces sp. H39-S7]